jgi:2OG-Fe(II) oxygenase superfamily
MKFDITTLHDKIDVYHNVIPNYSEFMDNVLLVKEDLWKPWGGFGHYTTLITQSYSGDPHEFETETQESDSNKAYVSSEFSKIFKEITSDYIKRNNVELPNWHSSDPQLCKYFPKKVKYTGLILPFHTDYQQERSKMPGIKHGITANLYINDNYEGGEVLFQVEPSEDIISYKAKAGDLVVFPSGAPYYHGVKNVIDGEKYIIRSFWHYRYDGDADYLLEKEKWDPQEWKEKEQLRQRVERNKYMKWIKVN